MQAHELESALRRGGEGQSRGRYGFLWLVGLKKHCRKVRVAGDNSAVLLARLWRNQLAGDKKLEPPPSVYYLDPTQMIEDIASLEPVSRTFQLRDPNWVRYTVECCGHIITTVAVNPKQLRANLYWGRSPLPFVPAESGIPWHEFRFLILAEKRLESWHDEEEPRIAPFPGRFCPTCDCLNGTRRTRCHECHSRLDMPAKEVLRSIPA